MRSCPCLIERKMNTRIIELDETDSTNRFLRGYMPETGEDAVVAVAEYQTAGRGQGTNSWESERGKNILFSILFRPYGVEPARQFVLSMAMAVAAKDVMAHETGGGVSVKWPNDIYWHDYKLGGTLIETAMDSHGMKSCTIGTGLNINQTVFRSDAPNPVSLANITGHEFERRPILDMIINRFKHYINIVRHGDAATIVRIYNDALYRKDGFHKYSNSHGEFEAETVGVEENGRLTLRDRHGKLRGYFFKEVKFIINNK